MKQLDLFDKEEEEETREMGQSLARTTLLGWRESKKWEFLIFSKIAQTK